MSFFRINDPKRRDAFVAEYMATTKRIREDNLARRMGDLSQRQELETHFTPLIESNEKASRAVRDELRPISKEVGNLTNYLRQASHVFTQVKLQLSTNF